MNTVMNLGEVSDFSEKLSVFHGRLLHGVSE